MVHFLHYKWEDSRPDTLRTCPRTHTGWNAKPRLELGLQTLLQSRQHCCFDTLEAALPTLLRAQFASPPASGREAVAGPCFHPFLLHSAPDSLGGLGCWAEEATKGTRAAAVQHQHRHYKEPLQIQRLQRWGVSRCLQRVGRWNHGRKAKDYEKGFSTSLLFLFS